MSFLWIILKHNLKWIAALALIFAFASGVLSNASSLSQWYSRTLTTEFLDMTRVDFQVNQKAIAQKTPDLHDLIPRLDEVEDVITEMHIWVGFPRTVEYFEEKNNKSLIQARSTGGCGTVHAVNGTKFILAPIHLCSYLGLEKLIEESDIGAPYPEQGETVVSRDLATLLGIEVGDNLTIETPNDLLTFRVSGITDLSLLSIQYKISKPDLPLKFFPSKPSVVELEFIETVSGELLQDVIETVGFRVNWFAVISLADSIDLFNSDWIAETFYSSINHYVYTDRESLVEPLNVDSTILNLKRTRDRIDTIVSEVPVNVGSSVLDSFESAAGEVNLFAVVAGSFMLAALPLYWFVASPLTGLFVEQKRREIALLRIKGLSTRGVYWAYSSLVGISAVIGSVLGVFLQANILKIFESLGVISPEYAATSTKLGWISPDASSLLLYVIISLFLAAFSVSKIIRAVSSFEPIESIRLRRREEEKSGNVGKLTILLLCLGLVKLVLQLVGWDAMVYLRYPPSNPFLAMGLSLFATFDSYALTPLAPVFLAYGSARIISAKSDKFGFLFRPFSFFAGFKKRKISFRLLSSEMWRTAASLVFIALALSYGIGGYVSDCTTFEHLWKMAGEFTGADIRIDCVPNATKNVEETVKTVPELLNYARIDVVASCFETIVESSHGGGVVALFIVDPETYIEAAYLENAPELQKTIASLEAGHIIGLRSAQRYRILKGQVITSGTFPINDIAKNWDQIALARLRPNETVTLHIDGWFNMTAPGTAESLKTSEMKASPIWRSMLSTPYDLPYRSTISSSLLPGTSEELLFDPGGFIIRQESVSDIKYEQVKSIFVVKLKSGEDPSKMAIQLRSTLGNGVSVITRSQAISVVRKGFPTLALTLDFTKINSTLIAAICIGGLVAITMTTATGRKPILSMLKIRGGKRKDGITLFLPEIALILFLACVLGITIGLSLGSAFVNSMADLFPPLFTGNTVQIFLSPSIGYFTATVLAVFCVAQIVSIAAKSVIDLGAL